MQALFADQFEHLLQAMNRLEQVLSRPVLLLAAGWHEPYSVNLGEDAAKRLIDLYVRLPDSDALPVLFIYGRGCSVAFADMLRRSNLPLHASYVMGRTLGPTTSVALCSRSLVMLPGAGLGAADAVEVIEQDYRAPSAEQWRVMPAEYKSMLLSAECAPHTRRLLLSELDAMSRQNLAERLLAAVLSSHFDREQREQVLELVDALSLKRLGRELGLGVKELMMLGLNARGPVESDELEAALELARQIEAEFAVLPVERPLFQDTELGEVEFELATGEPGALLASTQYAYCYELDTGSPDPDSGMLRGAWKELFSPF